MNDNSFTSWGLITQQKQDFEWLNSSVIGGLSLEISPNTYDASYIEVRKNDDGIYESYHTTDSLLADYNADLMNFAGYIQAKIEPLENLKVIASLRFDKINYSFDNNLGSNAFTAVLDGENSFERFTPKIGITYDLKNNRGIYANFSQGFVPPQVTELYRGNKIPELKPVFYDSYEVGGWMAFANGKGKLEVSVYRMDGLNEIISVLQDDGSILKQNAGKTTHQGIEYAVNLLIHKDLKLRISGTNSYHEFVDYNDSGTDFSGKKMPQAPQWIMNTQLTYKPSFLKGFRASIEWQHIDEYFMEAANEKSYSGFDVFNVRMGYQWKTFEIWTNILNASDQMYATVARSNRWGQSYSLGKPRNFNLGIAYKFQSK
jgi:outer membrane receptor protein involved in Fe transport